MLPQVLYLYPLNTQVIQLTELQDQITGLFLTAATCTATLVDQFGNADAVLNNIPMSYVPGTDATYQGQVPNTFNATIGGGYTLVVTAVQAGIQAQYKIPVVVQARTQ